MKTQADTNASRAPLHHLVRRIFGWAFPEVGQMQEIHELITHLRDEERRWAERRDDNNATMPKFRHALGVCDQLAFDIAALESIANVPAHPRKAKKAVDNAS